jgi:hypothetical protein
VRAEGRHLHQQQQLEHNACRQQQQQQQHVTVASSAHVMLRAQCGSTQPPCAVTVVPNVCCSRSSGQLGWAVTMRRASGSLALRRMQRTSTAWPLHSTPAQMASPSCLDPAGVSAVLLYCLVWPCV